MNKILIPVTLVTITLLGVFWIMLKNESIHDKECIFPEENTKNHENANCVVFTMCEFELINKTYHLVSYQVMIIPTTYMEDFDGTNCPRYYDLPGYKYFNDYQQDIGYGYCEVPFNIGCSQLMYNVISGSSTMDHSGILYKMRNYDNVVDYLSYAKTNEQGTNCPNKELFACEYFKSKHEYPIILLSITLFIQIIMILCNYIYIKYEYNLVNDDEETQKLQGTV